MEMVSRVELGLRSRACFAAGVALVLTCVGCSSEPELPPAGPGAAPSSGPVAGGAAAGPTVAPSGPMVMSPSSAMDPTIMMDGVAKKPGLCARERADFVRDVFCGDAPPTITGLQELQDALALSTASAEPGAAPMATSTTPGMVRAPSFSFFTVLGHSTALSGHLVSPINPRVISVGSQTFMTFQRGVQQLEVIALARGRGSLNFYLFKFQQACNRSPEGCSSGDLYTPRIERDWLSVTLEDDEDLKNTPADCRQCHQRNRPAPVMLMRELNNPWTHFFEPLAALPTKDPGVQGAHLLEDFLAAKGDELYGGFRLDTVLPIAPFLLETTVGNDQPVLFDAPGIENERWPYTPETGYAQKPGPSRTWNAALEAFKNGEQPALPYLEPRVSDEAKQSAVSAAYAKFRAGELPAEELPNVADVFPDDPQVRFEIGLATAPDATPAETMIQACGSCHNDVLDQTISRAKFNINLWKLDPNEIGVAIERMKRPLSAAGVMPPPEARQFAAGAREKLIEYLEGNPLSSEPDPKLVRAAELGMMGGAKRQSIARGGAAPGTSPVPP